MQRKKLLLLPALLVSLWSTAQVNLSSGLVAYYPFNGTFNDASGNGNDATPVNGASLGADKWGNPNAAASFDGVNDYLTVPAGPSITPGQQFSIAFRFKSNSIALQMLFSKSNFNGNGAPDNFQYQVGMNAQVYLGDNSLYFCSNHTNTCTTTNFYGSNYIFGYNTEPNEWICAAMTFDKGVKKIYMNGSLVHQTTLTNTSNNLSIDSCGGGTFRIGAWWANDPAYFSGLIDEVRLYNRALNAQEADSLCNLRPSVDGGSLSANEVTGHFSQAIIAPNPASDQIHIDIPHSASATIGVTVFNSLGQTMIRTTAQPGRTTIDVSALSPGMYQVQWRSDTQVATGKFIKR